VVCGAYLWFFGVQTFCALEARNIARKTPAVRQTPVELRDLSVSPAPGTKLSGPGYEFEVPWDDLDEARNKFVEGAGPVFNFRSGLILFVRGGPPLEMVNALLTDTEQGHKTVRQVYGDDALKSDYALYRIMLETMPASVTPFISRREAIRKVMLLILKRIEARRGSETAMLAVSAGDFKGFEYGSPQNILGGFGFELFSDTGSLDFVFGLKGKTNTPVSQSDINRILQTLHRLPPQPAASKPAIPR